MPFDPRKFIEISKELKNGKTEAHYRSIINRAYYGVFGYVRENLAISETGKSVHRQVIDTLTDSVSISDKKAGKRLETLFKQRKKADYNYRIEVKNHNCEYCINDAEEIIKLFETDDDY